MKKLPSAKAKQIVYLVSCASKKIGYRSPAQDLYVSDSFQKTRKVVEMMIEMYGGEWFILSALHGLVRKDQLLEPYDFTLGTASSETRKSWTEKVFAELKQHVASGSKVTIFAGESYRDFLTPRLAEIGCEITIPLEGLSIGQQLQLLKRIGDSPTRFSDYKRFYGLLDELNNMPAQHSKLSQFKAKEMPKQGVYFFYDANEFRRFSPASSLRVVRVGTHAVSHGSKSTLWQRLRAHKGTDDGNGSHRSSIFRLHIGNALLAQRQQRLDTWSIGENAPRETREREAWLEQEVSRYIADLRVSYLPVADPSGADSDRSYIEKNSIALLTHQGPIDVASSTWLGNFAVPEQIKQSGLWNINHIGSPYDSHFLDVFESLLRNAAPGGLVGRESIAPKGWREEPSNKTVTNPNQAILF